MSLLHHCVSTLNNVYFKFELYLNSLHTKMFEGQPIILLRRIFYDIFELLLK